MVIRWIHYYVNRTSLSHELCAVDLPARCWLNVRCSAIANLATTTARWCSRMNGRLSHGVLHGIVLLPSLFCTHVSEWLRMRFDRRGEIGKSTNSIFLTTNIFLLYSRTFSPWSLFPRTCGADLRRGFSLIAVVKFQQQRREDIFPDNNFGVSAKLGRQHNKRPLL